MLPFKVKPYGRRDYVKVARRDLDRISHLLSIMENPADRRGGIHLLPKLGGGAQLLATSPAAAPHLTSSQVAFLGPLIGIPQDPLVLALCSIPQMATQTAAATIVLNFNRTDTPAVIGGCSYLTPTAGTAASAPITMFAVVPFGIPAASGVSVSGSDTAQTAVPTGSATQPMVLAILGLS